MKVLYNDDFIEKKDAHMDIGDRDYQSRKTWRKALTLTK